MSPEVHINIALVRLIMVGYPTGKLLCQQAELGGDGV